MELNFTASSALSVHVMTHLLNFGITTYLQARFCNSCELCQISHCLFLLHNPTRGDSTAQPGFTAIMPNGAALKENEKESSLLLKYDGWTNMTSCSCLFF